MQLWALCSGDPGNASWYTPSLEQRNISFPHISFKCFSALTVELNCVSLSYTFIGAHEVPDIWIIEATSTWAPALPWSFVNTTSCTNSILFMNCCLPIFFGPICELISSGYEIFTSVESKTCRGVHFNDAWAFKLLLKKCLLRPKWNGNIFQLWRDKIGKMA